MKVFVVTDSEDVRGTFSSLKKSKEYVEELVNFDLYRFGDLVIPYYEVYSEELDRNDIEEGKHTAKLEWSFYDGDERTTGKNE